MNRIFYAGLLCLAIAAPSRAAVIHSTFRPGDAFVCCTAYAITGPQSSFGDWDQGSPFRSRATYVFDGIDVAFQHFEGVNEGDMWLMSDDAGHPGDILEALHFAGLPASTTDGVVSAESVRRPVLSAGTVYWLIASADSASFLGFNLSDSLPLARGRAIRKDGGAWEVSRDRSAAFRVRGTLVAVPEPSTLLLAGLGGAAAAIHRRRRWKKALPSSDLFRITGAIQAFGNARRRVDGSAVRPWFLAGSSGPRLAR